MNLNPVSNLGASAGAQFEAARMQQEMQSFETALQNAANNLESLDDIQLRRATIEFESFFLNMMLREMRRTTGNEHSFLPKSNAERIFQEMLDEEKARVAANAGGIGLADMMFRQLRQTPPSTSGSPENI